MGKRIRHLREAKGLSQSQLGKLVGVTKGAVSQWENDDTANPKIRTILNLCKELGTDINYLVYGPKREADQVVPFPPTETGKLRILRRRWDKGS